MLLVKFVLDPHCFLRPRLAFSGSSFSLRTAEEPEGPVHLLVREKTVVVMGTKTGILFSFHGKLGEYFDKSLEPCR